MTLVERLSAATEGSWQLDSEIHVAAGRCLHRETKTVYYEDGESSDSTTRCKACGVDTYGAKVPEYSRSIDSALTLVDEADEYNITNIYGVAAVSLPLNSDHCQTVTRKDGNVILAFVECALRAREAR